MQINGNSRIAVDTLGIGNGGNLFIVAENLIGLSNNSQISASTLFNSKGDAGNITIETADLIVKDNSNIVTITEEQGNAGQIFKLTATNSIDLSNNSSIAASVLSSGKGNGGNVTVITNDLTLNNNSDITASTAGEGDAGNVFVLSDNSIKLSDSSGILATVLSGGTGNGGNITIGTNYLDISNLSEISVSTAEQTNGGNLYIEATESIFLNKGKIAASTQLGDGGNLTLTDFEMLVFENNSLVSAESFTNNRNGGNIFIDGDFLIAFPNQNNDIIANNTSGFGGNIELNTEVLFGIEVRRNHPDTNDIDASGEVNFNQPQTLKLRDLSNVSLEIVSIESMSRTCSTASLDEETSGLAVKGRGGTPPEPTEPLDAETLIVDDKITANGSQNNNVGTFHGTVGVIDELPPQGENYSALNSEEIHANIQPVAYQDNGEPIYLARGVIKQKDGSVILTAYPTDNTESRTVANQYNCD